jgi:hypothetical protein
MKKTTQPKVAVKDSLHQLKITLAWTNPEIWRRVVVPSGTTLDIFHQIIQAAMGWHSCHLYQFVAGKRPNLVYYGSSDFAERGEMEDDSLVSIADLAPKARSKFRYEYDFGDSWIHEILTEKILPPDPSIKHPVCLDGANACPPEDCGGVGGFYNMVEALQDPNHPEHDDFADWIDEGWNPEVFDLNGVNAKLRRIRVS